MAIQKRFIHFKKFSDFNSKKLSANETNTQYTVGVSGAIQDGEPDILYQSYVWIKDTKQQWTHGQLYNGIDTPIVKGDAKNSAVLKESENKVNGKFSIAVGYGNNISGDSSAAFGYNNIVENNCCTAEGANNKVCGENSHVGGRECIVEGHESYAEGNYTKVYGHCSHGEGTSCRVLGDNSHVEGLSSVVYGHISHAEGQFCAAGDLDQVDKISDERTDYGCHAEGIRTTAKEMASHSEGIDTHSMGVASHAEGRGSYTSGDASHAEGLNTKAGIKGFYFKGIDIKNKKIYLSTTKPDTIKTSGFSSSDFENIEFPYDIESDLLSIINGEIYYDSLKVTKTNRSVIYVESLPFTSVAEFNELFKNSNYTIFCLSKYKLGAVSVSFGCHSEGYETRSFGFGSHSDGYNTIAKNVGEHASGIYNVSNSDTQFSIGIGTSDTNRKNAFEVKQNGDIYVEGVEGKIQDKLNTSPDWNAQKRQIGYIENKPFFDYINLKLLSVFEVISEEYSEGGYADKNGIVTYQLESYGNVFPLYIKHPRAVMGEFNGYMITKMNPGDEIYKSIGEVRDKYYKITAGLDTTDENSVKSKITIEASGNFNVNNIYCHDWEEDDFPIAEIDKNYIPDTVIKTTPQTLSDTDKNQALVNLGIQEKINKLVNITYSELKSLRDNSQLIPGQQYRITDYITTTVQENTQSAGHQFDVIVTADNENTLNEVARACLHKGDTYFSEAGANLAAWQIWYSLDNDTERFAWADGRFYISQYGGYIIKRVREEDFVEEGQQYYAYLSEEDIIVCTKDEKVSIGSIFYSADDISYEFGVVDDISGKGVIYRMIDERNNDCPYDFKNIQFKRCKVTSDLEGADLTTLEQEYVGYPLSGYGASMPLHISLVDTSDYKYVYTFSGVNNGSIVDASLGTSGIACYDNSMKLYIASNVQYLNDIVMYAHPESGNHCITKNTFASDCFSMTLGCEQVGEVWDNHFGQYCKNNIILGPYVYQNDFGANLTACYFSQQVSQNQIGLYMQRNFINNTFVQNVLGPNCKDNIFMKKCSLNTIGEQFMNNTCNDEFYQNNLGAGFLENTFNGKFYSNVSYNQFMRNTINGQCSCCDFGTQCTGNTLGIFRNSKVGSLFMSNVLCDTMACVFGIGFNCNNVTATKMQCSTFGTYAMYNNWTSSGNVKNIKVSDYLQGTTSSYNNIELPADSVCEVKVAKNSSGDIKIYCEADLIS